MSTASVKPIPNRLKQDALIEALLEIRFQTSPSILPEIIVGRLADCGHWRNFQQRRLPASEIPAPIRQVDESLRYTPLLELSEPERKRLVRIGDRVISCHQLVPYGGWGGFRPELFATVDALFSIAATPTIKRLGLRYINALRPAIHHVASITDLDLTVSVAREKAPPSINLNFTTEVGEDTDCTVRIATSTFISGTLPPNTAVVIDVDVFTKETFETKSIEEVKAWVDAAHATEKEQFFRLLTRETIDALTEG